MADRRTAERKRGERPAPAKRPAGRAPGAQSQLQTLSFSRKNWILLAAGIASVALGFLFLRFGDITVAPILLLAGYLVLIPWALIARRKNRERRDQDPQDARI
jgi:Flp pilus assembly protein TadB